MRACFVLPYGPLDKKDVGLRRGEHLCVISFRHLYKIFDICTALNN